MEVLLLHSSLGVFIGFILEVGHGTIPMILGLNLVQDCLSVALAGFGTCLSRLVWQI